MIMHGELRAGAKVVVRLLSERLRLSTTPIKAALAGLERNGFLTAVAHRGYFVPGIQLWIQNPKHQTIIPAVRRTPCPTRR